MPVIRAAPPTPLPRTRSRRRKAAARAPGTKQPSDARSQRHAQHTAPSTTPGHLHHPGRRRVHPDAHQARQQDSAPLATTAPYRLMLRRAHHACGSRLKTPSKACPKQCMQFTTASPQPTRGTDEDEAGTLRTYRHASHAEAISRAIKKPLKRGFFRLAE